MHVVRLAKPVCTPFSRPCRKDGEHGTRYGIHITSGHYYSHVLPITTLSIYNYRNKIHLRKPILPNIILLRRTMSDDRTEVLHEFISKLPRNWHKHAGWCDYECIQVNWLVSVGVSGVLAPSYPQRLVMPTEVLHVALRFTYPIPSRRTRSIYTPGAIVSIPTESVEVYPGVRHSTRGIVISSYAINKKLKCVVLLTQSYGEYVFVRAKVSVDPLKYCSPRAIHKLHGDAFYGLR